MPWKRTPLKIDWIKLLLLVKIFCFAYIEKIKKPKATKKNLNANAEKGSLLSIIGFVVTKADDHKIIKMNGKILIILGL